MFGVHWPTGSMKPRSCMLSQGPPEPQGHPILTRMRLSATGIDNRVRHATACTYVNREQERDCPTVLTYSHAQGDTCTSPRTTHAIHCFPKASTCPAKIFFFSKVTAALEPADAPLRSLPNVVRCGQCRDSSAVLVEASEPHDMHICTSLARKPSAAVPPL